MQWKERLKGEYRASPVAADGRIYFLNTKGLTTVMAASPRLNRLAENQLNAETLASPAISDGRIYIRGQEDALLHREMREQRTPLSQERRGEVTSGQTSVGGDLSVE